MTSVLGVIPQRMDEALGDGLDLYIALLDGGRMKIGPTNDYEALRCECELAINDQVFAAYHFDRAEIWGLRERGAELCWRGRV